MKISCIPLHRIHQSFDICQWDARIQAVDHHQTALLAAQLRHLLADQRIDRRGRAAVGDLLAVDVQVDAHLAGKARRDPVDAVDQVLQVDDLDAGFQHVVHQQADVAVGVHVDDAAGVQRGPHQPLVAGPDVLAKMPGRHHRPHLHAQVLGVRHPLRARGQVALDDREVELLQHGDEPAQPRDRRRPCRTSAPGSRGGRTTGGRCGRGGGRFAAACPAPSRLRCPGRPAPS